jgi:hypothetical protein
MKEFHILNFGCGQQSTSLYLMSSKGDEPDFVPHFDYSLFADTGDEPSKVYDHIEYMLILDPENLPIRILQYGKLSDDMINGHHKVIRGEDCKYRAGEVIDQCSKTPVFCKKSETGRGQMPRECTGAYKIGVIEKFIRSEILNVPYGKPVPSGSPIIHQYFGISYDERSRASKIRNRFAKCTWAIPHFPLIDMEMSRSDCVTYNTKYIPYEVPRSLCWHCPYRTNAMWNNLRKSSPEDFEKACRLDEQLRESGTAMAEDCEYPLYIHRSCIPLRIVNLDVKDSGRGTLDECDGVCGL